MFDNKFDNLKICQPYNFVIISLFVLVENVKHSFNYKNMSVKRQQINFTPIILQNSHINLCHSTCFLVSDSSLKNV